MIKKIYLEVVISISLFTLCLLGLIFEVSTYSGESAIMPFGVLLIAGILSIIWLVQVILKIRNPLDATDEIIADKEESKKFFVFFCITFIYVIVISFIGFFTATIIAIPIISMSMGYRSLIGILITTVLFTSIILIIFSLFLKVPLPIEIWNRLLGSS